MHQMVRMLGRVAGLSALGASAGFADVLARIDGPPAQLPPDVPVYACLLDARGTEYALVFAAEEALQRVDRPYTVLSREGMPADHVLARPPRHGTPTARAGELVGEDGRTLLLRATTKDRVALADAGFVLKPLPAAPNTTRLPRALPAPHAVSAVTHDARVAEMLQQVKPTNLHALVSQWAGDAPAVTGGDLYTVLTRNTSSYVPLGKASQSAAQHLEALGLAVSSHHWNAGGYSNRNVVATLPGGALSSQIVLVTAHLDSTSPTAGTRAPGADDNASGCAAVLVAADLLRRFQFDRTIRFVLFTGEEQGLYGSERYASLVAGAGEDVVAVFNLDMVAWDSGGGPTLRIHTRSSGSAGYAGDQAIATTFTNVVGTYGLGVSLSPIITADNEWASDHSSFWDAGYPAVLAIEDDYNDFHAYYHTTNDTLARLNLPYFTAFTKASIGTVAHLAQIAGRVPFDVIQVDSSDWKPGSGIGVGTFYARHEPGATEAAADGRDVTWSSAPTNPYGRWLRIQTQPYGTALATDARPSGSETLFRGHLVAVTTGAAPFSCTNGLRFTHLSALESNRAYTVRVQVDARYASPSNAYVCVTNLRSLVAAGGYLPLPLLTNLTNGAVYGTLDIAPRLLAQDAASWGLAAASRTGDGLALDVATQVGFPVVDVLEYSTNLPAVHGWQALGSYTGSVPPTAGNFESGWGTLAWPATSRTPMAHVRVRRQWQPP